MSITTWCIIGMIACAIIGYLRTKNRQGAVKTIIIIVYTVAFVFFLIGTLATRNGSNVATDNNSVSIEEKANDTQLCTYFKSLEENGVLNFKFTKGSEIFLNEHPEYFKNTSSTLVYDDMNFIVDYKDILSNAGEYGNRIVFLPAASVISVDYTDENKGGATMVQLSDDDGNYYLLISDQHLSEITEGIYVGGYYTPVGTVEFENDAGTTTKGIMGAVAVLEAN